MKLNHIKGFALVSVIIACAAVSCGKSGGGDSSSPSTDKGNSPLGVWVLPSSSLPTDVSAEAFKVLDSQMQVCGIVNNKGYVIKKNSTIQDNNVVFTKDDGSQAAFAYSLNTDTLSAYNSNTGATTTLSRASSNDISNFNAKGCGF